MTLIIFRVHLVQKMFILYYSDIFYDLILGLYCFFV